MQNNFIFALKILRKENSLKYGNSLLRLTLIEAIEIHIFLFSDIYMKKIVCLDEDYLTF